MPFFTPPFPAPATHERGVFRDQHALPGLVVFRVYSCDGVVREVASVEQEWADEAIEGELRASLDRRCPVAPHAHGEPPPRLRIV